MRRSPPELRTPLTLDRALLQVTLRDPNATAGQWSAVGQELLESGRQQERILEALLTLATSEAGLSRHEPADLSEAAAVGLSNADARIQRRQLRVHAQLGPAPLHIHITHRSYFNTMHLGRVPCRSPC
jgi:signal transduction histidine kinase